MEAFRHRTAKADRSHARCQLAGQVDLVLNTSDFARTSKGEVDRCPHGSSPEQASLEHTASIHEHHGLAPVEDYAILKMMPHRAGQHAAFDVAALAREIFRCVAVADALDVLVDDRAFVEIAGDVMR